MTPEFDLAEYKIYGQIVYGKIGHPVTKEEFEIFEKYKNFSHFWGLIREIEIRDQALEKLYARIN